MHNAFLQSFSVKSQNILNQGLVNTAICKMAIILLYV